MEEKLELEYSNAEKEEKHLNEDANLDESRLSVESEIDGQEECGKMLKNYTIPKQGVSGGYKRTYILGNNDFINFFSKNGNNDVLFDYQRCFYYALLRTIENVKGIKFIGKDIQRFAGKDLFNTQNDSELHSCLCLIAVLLFQDREDDQWEYIKTIVQMMLEKITLQQAKETLKKFPNSCQK
ncbi:MAG: hypothetical protein IJT15_00775 [Rickettsiales bacterium]|nr:hypothetical protein [Rickettsiales bacterium]